jgi:hypothetical protein
MLTEGCHKLTAADYHAGKDMPAPMLSASIIKILLDQSPAHARLAHAQLNPDLAEENEQKFDIGTAVHDLFLEGVDQMEVIEAENWRTKAAREARDTAYAAGKIPLLKHQVGAIAEIALAIENQLADHGDARDAFSNGEPQQTLVWQENGVWCKAMLDWLPRGSSVFTDLKTTSVSANPEAWVRGPFFSTGCDIQAAFYLRGIRKVLQVRNPVFQFCVVETTPPNALSIVAAGEAVLTLADKKIDHALAVWKRCLETDQWPAYPSRTAWAELPSHLLSRWEEREEREQSRQDIERYLTT